MSALGGEGKPAESRPRDPSAAEWPARGRSARDFRGGRALAHAGFLAAAVLALAAGCAAPSRPLARFATHVVAPGETVWEISRRYGVPVSAVTRSNRLSDPSRVYPGQRLRIPRAGSRAFTRSPRAPAERVPRAITSGGRPGVLAGPPAAGSQRPRSQRGASDLAPAPAWIWPVRGQLTSGYGWRRGRQHSGVDILAPRGTPVRAAAPGRVIHSGRGVSGYGNLVIVRHSRTQVSVYAHHRRNLARVGEWVEQGRVLGEVGQTGRATGPHLHFEIREDGIARNPLEFLP